MHVLKAILSQYRSQCVAVLPASNVSLRCWWAEPQAVGNDIELKSLINRVYIVLPEVFGVNAWVRSVADRLAAQGYPALAVPLFSRTAPDLELAYDASDLAEAVSYTHLTLPTTPYV